MNEYMSRDFSLISVKSLCAATPVARTTFYSYFNNMYEVKESVEDDLIDGLIAVSERVSKGNFPDMDFEIFMDETEKYIKDNWSYIYAFLVRQPNIRFMRKWKDAIKMNLERRYPDKQPNSSFPAIAEIVASSMLSAYTYWMENPDNSSTKEIKPLFQKLLDSLVDSM